MTSLGQSTSTSPSAKPSKLSSQMAVAVLFVVFVFLSIVATAGWRAWKAYHVTLEQAQTTTTNLARSLSQHVEDAIKVSDTVLTSTVERVETEGTNLRSRYRLHKLFVRQVQDLPQFHGMFLFDEAGKYLASSQPTLPKDLNILDRSYFKFHQQNNDRKAHIGPPVRSKTTGEWMVTVSKRINRRDGRFAGVASATIRMDYFKEFHRRLDIGDKGVIFITFHNGVMLTRQPFVEEIIGTRVRNSIINPVNLSGRRFGSFITSSPVDQTERLYSYNYTDAYPLIAVIGLSKDEILATWRADMSSYAVGLALIAAILGLLGWRLIYEIRLGITSERNLVKAQVSLKRLNRMLEGLALQDGLTGIANRRHFDMVLETEFKRAVRGNVPLCLMMMDVDYFKAYNDLYGHPAGDKCLKAISGALIKTINRAGDLPARYGGEEFVVLMPNTDLISAESIAQRVHSAVADLKLLHAGSPAGHITISIGIASFLPSKDTPNTKLKTVEEFMKEADMALYMAKRNGRNRVCTSNDNITSVLDY